MPDYNDYRFDAQPGMRVDTWRALKPWLTRVTPGPLAHPVLASPTSDLSAPSAMVPAEFWWLAQTFGYGHPAMCYVNWCLKAGLGLTSAQKAALRRMARARAVMLHRVLFEMPGPPLALHARDIYPLIEPSEKAGVSYLLGGGYGHESRPPRDHGAGESCSGAPVPHQSSKGSRDGGLGTVNHPYKLHA